MSASIKLYFLIAFGLPPASISAAATVMSAPPMVESAPTFASVKTGPVAKTAVAKNSPNVKAHDAASAMTTNWRCQGAGLRTPLIGLSL